MKTFGTVRKRKNELNITSLIDVVFMLLIFFMISSSFDKPAIQVKLPSATSGEKVERKVLEVTVTTEGIIYLGDQIVSLENLGGAIAPFIAQNPEITASLNCDGELPFRRVTEVMDVLKQGGLQNVAIRHEKCQ